MASLIPSIKTKGSVIRRIEFFPVDGGKRKRINLGRITAQAGEEFLQRIEAILQDLRLGQRHSGPLCEWLNALPPKEQQRLQKYGLHKASILSAQPLGAFLDDWQSKMRVKGGTLTVYGHVIRNLVEHFGASRMMQTIGPVDALGFKEYLEEPKRAYGFRPLSRATINRRIKMAKQFFAAAQKRKLIVDNPFDDVKGGHQRNPARLVFVDAAWVDKLLAATTNQDWKLILLLSRYGGLRMPSELVKLRWQHVDFARRRILIHAIKTEGYEGKETRFVPIFDELYQPLMDAFAAGVEPTDFVIKNINYRTEGGNMRTQLAKIAKRAGVTLWMKPFQNMRSTRETELIERLDLKAACAIIGNSEIIALLHYAQIRPLYLESAIEVDRAATEVARQAALKLSETKEGARKAMEAEKIFKIVSPLEGVTFTPVSDVFRETPTNHVGDEGFEPPASSV